jgi:Spy/CpxP family protein refolding chaperone
MRSGNFPGEILHARATPPARRRHIANIHPMNNRIKLLLSAASLLLAAGLQAQNSAPTEEQRQARREKARPAAEARAKELGLTDEQQAQLKSIHQQEQDALKALKDNTTLSKEEKRAQAKTIRETARTQSNSVFTAEQQAKIAERRAARQQGGGDGVGPRGPRGGGREGGPGAGGRGGRGARGGGGE